MTTSTTNPLLTILACGFLLLASATVQAEPADQTNANLRLVITRYRQMLLNHRAPSPAVVKQTLDTLLPDGRWPDVDYTDRSAANWKPREHLYHVRQLVLAYHTEGHPYYHDPAVADAARAGLEHWVAKRYQCPNWWYNEIGIPREMRDIAVLHHEQLTGELRTEVLEVIGQHRVAGTGANLTWSAEIAMHHGCLAGNEPQVAKAAARLFSAITVGQNECIQTDWSFFQHGARLHTFGYGRAFLDVVVPIAWQLRDTPWEIPADKRQMITNYLLEGTQWMSRGIYVSSSTFDRQISRRNQHTLGDLRKQLRLWIEVDPSQQSELELYLARLESTAEPLVGHRHFPVADFTAHHRPAGTFFLKTLSTRTRRTESINRENLKGVPYLHSGDLYILRDGAEYCETQPVLDWNLLPGITTSEGDRQQHKLPFVGGISHGQTGMTAMDYRRDREGEALAFSVRKSWFFADDVVICLMSGWQVAADCGAMTTSVDQCRYRGQLSLKQPGGAWTSLDSSGGTQPNVQCVLHHSVGYLALGDTRLDCQAAEQSGTWASINQVYRDQSEPVRLPMLQVTLPHAAEPTAAGYAIVLDASQERLDQLTSNPPWTVLQNSRDCQAIELHTGATMAAFFAPGELEIDGQLRLAVDRPCLAMVADDRLLLCDPTHEGGRISVNWQGQQRDVELATGGIATEVPAEKTVAN
ncbi:polysaccharide lyase family 8 super-sandwich domain-containing protein [Aeoliella mucimassa]|uniref:polysaccharide lyase family 8 super-sandwich domain-containing protein n=1 Tax=Aeoliella mucimassa TaxID=2527972 RepID=UPI0018D287DA|nr:polysaccharide lyase family 8 super-sandwich domain-containing protein [Aeoliella mucimassa]